MESKNKKIAFITLVVLVLLTILLAVLNFTSKGFKIATYATENLIAEQIEEILSEDRSNVMIEEVFRGNIEDAYLGIFNIENSMTSECLIVDYKEVGKIGKHKILEINRIVKGENGLVVIVTDENHLIYSSIDEDQYIGLNILNEKNELIEEIVLEDLDSKSITKLDNGDFILKYNNIELNGEIEVELVRRNDY